LLDEILTAEIKARMADIDAEFAGKSQAVADKIAALEAEIKQDVLTNGASVKGQFSYTRCTRRGASHGTRRVWTVLWLRFHNCERFAKRVTRLLVCARFSHRSAALNSDVLVNHELV
jgi:hypothetical protein